MKTSTTHWPLCLALAFTLLPATFPLLAQTPPPANEQNSTEIAATNTATLEEPEAGNTNPMARPPRAPGAPSARHAPAPHRTGEVVMFGRSVEVKKGETVQSVVVFGGSVTVHGKVRQDVVVFGGGVDVDGEIGGDLVIFGSGANVQSNSTVKGDAVAFGGGITVETNATIHGDAVTFGGTVDVAEGGSVKGDVVPFGLGAGKWGMPKWLQQWLVHCVFKLRPLALQVGWVWVVAGLFFLFYLFIAVVFPRPVQACVNELSRRPATTFLLGLAAKLVVPLVIFLLALTGIGLVVVPFIAVALVIGAAVGKVALLEWLGLGLGRRFGAPALQKPLLAFLLGTVLLTLCYLTWVVGLLVFVLFSIWGLGIAVTAAFGGMRRELPEKTAPPTAPKEPPVMAADATAAPGPGAFGTPAASAPFPGSATATMEPQVQPSLTDLDSYPRAGFWERMGAAFLDVVLVGLLAGLIHGPMSFLPRIIGGPPFGLLVALAYFAGMWTWKGTTIGGIVLGLKVVRLDRRPITFAVALVRALAGAFSVVVLFLGFLWIAWDREKQGWHDIIAGTVVLRLPRGTPLVCL
jgi:uncharacterized RDD family membrane protein YckC